MDPVMLILQLILRKIIRIVIPISRLPVLATPKGSRPNAGTCTENYNVNVSSEDVSKDQLLSSVKTHKRMVNIYPTI